MSCVLVLSKMDVFHDVLTDVPGGVKVDVQREVGMSIRIVKRYSLEQERVQIMLHLYSDGVPAYIISQEFLIHPTTLRRLIKKYEAEKGPLRVKKVIRYKRT